MKKISGKNFFSRSTYFDFLKTFFICSFQSYQTLIRSSRGSWWKTRALNSSVSQFFSRINSDYIFYFSFFWVAAFSYCPKSFFCFRRMMQHRSANSLHYNFEVKKRMTRSSFSNTYILSLTFFTNFWSYNMFFFLFYAQSFDWLLLPTFLNENFEKLRDALRLLTLRSFFFDAGFIWRKKGPGGHLRSSSVTKSSLFMSKSPNSWTLSHLQGIRAHYLTLYALQSLECRTGLPIRIRPRTRWKFFLPPHSGLLKYSDI